MNFFLILYAHDMIIMAESENELQLLLLKYEEYCTDWKLRVNTQKTKIVGFGKRKYKMRTPMKLYGVELETVDSYSYLGLLFNFNGSFCAGRKKITDQANKAMYALNHKLQNNAIPIDI